MAAKTLAPYPYQSINGEFLDKEFLDDVWRHLRKQSVIWSAGIAEPTPADRLAYAVLLQITARMPEETP